MCNLNDGKPTSNGTLVAYETVETAACNMAEDHVGQYRYWIKHMRASSDKFGPCEVCNSHVSDVVRQVEEHYFTHETGRFSEGWTHSNCNTLFGHEHCLIKRRRGTFLRSMTKEGVDYQVHSTRIA